MTSRRVAVLLVALLFSASAFAAEAEIPPQALEGTKPLEWEGDLADRMVTGIDRFLLAEWDKAVGERGKYWSGDTSSVEAYRKSIEPNRARLRHMLGIDDWRPPAARLELIATPGESTLVGKSDAFHVYAVRWKTHDDVHGEGLLLEPQGEAQANIVALPDADQTPEQLAGLTEVTSPQQQIARQLAEQGCRVLVPTLIDRTIAKRAPPGRDHGAMTTNREWIYRHGFVLGRHPLGYEVAKAIQGASAMPGSDEVPLGIVGWGEGGLVALLASSLDDRFDSTLVSGYFGDNRDRWNQPLDRNLFGLLREFGDAELGAMIVGRELVIEAARGPQVSLPPGQGGAPAELRSPDMQGIEREYGRMEQYPIPRNFAYSLSRADRGAGQPFSTGAPTAFARGLSFTLKKDEGQSPEVIRSIDAKARQASQIQELERHHARLLTESASVRDKFMAKLDTSSPENYAKTSAEYRETFDRDVIGQFEQERMPLNPRSRFRSEGNGWTSYDVVLDVYPEVFAYGVLLMPNNVQPDEKRPVVVCQHGLEGRPSDTIEGDHDAYHDFAAKLAERGFIVFAPQNPYLFGDRFRTLQRKANPLGTSLFSIITAQHRQIVRWLAGLPSVDPERIAFYGLSYGGKTAMRVPALIPEYCLSICSADFNEWVWKNSSTLAPHSYVWTGEYEIFEFNLGRTFNYAEMAALIAPRPFMVERGHFDGVAPDETVGYEFAKVRNLYQARLGLKNRCEIEWFVGPHTINGQGTFEFLHRHLNWPKQ